MLLSKPTPTSSPKPVCKCEALVKVNLHNTVTRAIIMVAEQGPNTKRVIAEVSKWSLVGTFTVTVHDNQVLQFKVTECNDKAVAVTKTLVLQLPKKFKINLEGTKFVVLKAVEDTTKGTNGEKQKLLHLWMDAQIILTTNLSTLEPFSS